MTRSFAAVMIVAFILVACAPAAAPASPPSQPQQPQQPPAAMPQPAQPAQITAPPGAIQPPTVQASLAPPELRPPASGGQLNPPTPAPTISSRLLASTMIWQTYRDSSLGLRFQYPADWRTTLVATPPAPSAIVQRIDLAPSNQTPNPKVSVIVRQKPADVLAWVKQELPAGSLMLDARSIEGGLNSIRSGNAQVARQAAIFIYAPEHGSNVPAMAALFVTDSQYVYQFVYTGDVPDRLTNRAIYLQLLNTITLARATAPGLTLPRTAFTVGVITP